MRTPDRFAAATVLVALLVLAGCDGAGVMRTDDGRWLGLTPANVRDQVESTIDQQVDAELGAHWRSATAIAELPYRDTDEWSWRAATARVDLVGDGAAPLPIAEAEVERAVRAYLAHKVDTPRALSVTVVQVIDAPRLAKLVKASAPPDRHSASDASRDASAAATAPASAAAAGASAAAPSPTTDGSRYAIQAGDTLAAISSAFYGTPQHWRRIAEANPGIDAAHLVPGSVITVPPAP